MEQKSRKVTDDHCRRLLGRKPPLGLRAEYTRHGKAIFTVRLPGIYHQMKSAHGSTEFWREYSDASRGLRPRQAPAARGANAGRAAGSLGWLIGQFRASKKWPTRKNTAANYNSILRRIEEMNGAEPVIGITSKSIADLRDEIAKTSPTMADHFVSVMRVVMGWAASAEAGALIPANPAVGVTKVGGPSEHHTMWTSKDRAQFCARWEPGSPERLAYALLFGAGQRRSDVVRMGPRMLTDDGEVMVLTQVKTGKEVAIPMSHEWMDVAAEIAAARVVGVDTYIVGRAGSPRSADDFGRWFGAAAKAAGLADHTAHGLRRSASAAAVEAGWSAGQLCAVFGYTLQQAEDYIKEFSREKVARGLIRKPKAS